MIEVQDPAHPGAADLAERLRQNLAEEAAHKLVNDLIAQGQVTYSNDAYKLPPTP